MATSETSAAQSKDLNEIIEKIQGFKADIASLILIHGPNHESVANQFHLLGYAQKSSGDLLGAIESFNKALKIRKEVYNNVDNEIIIDNEYIIGKITALKDGNDEDSISAFTNSIMKRKEALQNSNTGASTNAAAFNYHSEALQDYYESSLVYSDYAEEMRLKGDYETATLMYNKAIESRKIKYGENHPSLIPILIQYGDFLSLQGKIQPSIEIFEDALSMAYAISNNISNKISNKQNYIAEILNSLGLLHLQLANFEQTESLLLESLSIRRAIYTDCSIEVAQTLNNIAELYRELQNYSKAVAFHEASIEAFIMSVGPNHPGTMNAKGNMGITLRRQSRKGNAIGSQLLHSTLTYINANSASDAPAANIYSTSDNSSTLTNAKWKNKFETEKMLEIAENLMDSGKNADSVKIIESIVDANAEKTNNRVQYSADHKAAILDTKITALIKQSIDLNSRGKFSEALTNGQYCKDFCISEIGASNNPYLDTVNFVLAESSFYFGDYSNAIDLCIALIQTRVDQYGIFSGKVADCTTLLAKLYIKTNNFNEADKLISQSLEIVDAMLKNEEDIVLRTLSPVTELFLDTLLTQFDMFYYSGNYIQCQAVIFQISSIFDKMLNVNDNPIKARIFKKMGKFNFLLGKISEAMNNFTLSLEICNVCFGQNHIITSSVQYYLCMIAFYKNNLNVASTLLETSFQMRKRCLNDNNCDIFQSLLWKAKLYLSNGNMDMCRDILQILSAKNQTLTTLVNKYHLLLVDFNLLFAEYQLCRGFPLEAVKYVEVAQEILQERRYDVLQVNYLSICCAIVYGRCLFDLGCIIPAKIKINEAIGNVQKVFGTLFDKSIKDSSKSNSASNSFFQHQLLVDAYGVMTRIHNELGQLTVGAEIIKKNGLQVSKLYGDDCVMSSSVLLDMAELMKLRGLFRDSKAVYNTFIASFSKAIGKSKGSALATALRAASDNLYEAGYYEDSLAFISASADMWGPLTGSSSSLHMILTNFMKAKVLFGLDKFDESEKVLFGSLASLNNTLGQQNAHYPKMLLFLAQLMEVQQDYAIPCFILNLLKSQFTSYFQDPTSTDPNSNLLSLYCDLLLVVILNAQSKFKESVYLLYNILIPNFEKMFGKLHPISMYAKGLIGACFNKLKKDTGNELLESSIVFFLDYNQFLIPSNHYFVFKLLSYVNKKNMEKFNLKNSSTSFSKDNVAEKETADVSIITNDNFQVKEPFDPKDLWINIKYKEKAPPRDGVRWPEVKSTLFKFSVLKEAINDSNFPGEDAKKHINGLIQAQSCTEMVFTEFMQSKFTQHSASADAFSIASAPLQENNLAVNVDESSALNTAVEEIKNEEESASATKEQSLIEEKVPEKIQTPEKNNADSNSVNEVKLNTPPKDLFAEETFSELAAPPSVADIATSLPASSIYLEPVNLNIAETNNLVVDNKREVEEVSNANTDADVNISSSSLGETVISPEASSSPKVESVEIISNFSPPAPPTVTESDLSDAKVSIEVEPISIINVESNQVIDEIKHEEEVVPNVTAEEVVIKTASPKQTPPKVKSEKSSPKSTPPKSDIKTSTVTSAPSPVLAPAVDRTVSTVTTAVSVADAASDSPRTRFKNKSVLAANFLFERGLELFEAGQYYKALPLLEECKTVRNSHFEAEKEEKKPDEDDFDPYEKLEDELKVKINDKNCRLGIELCEIVFIVGKCYVNIGNFETGEKYLQEALDLSKAISKYLVSTNVGSLLSDIYKESRLKMAEILLSFSDSKHDQGDYFKADWYFSEIAKLLAELKLNDENFAIYAYLYMKQSMNCYRLGKIAECKALFEQATPIILKVFGKKSIENSNILFMQSLMASYSGKFKELKTILEQCLFLRKSILGENHTLVADCFYLLAQCEYENGNIFEAEKRLKQALNIRFQTYGDNHYKCIEIYYYYAYLALEKTNYSQLFYMIYEKVLKTCDKIKITDEKDVALEESKGEGEKLAYVNKLSVRYYKMNCYVLLALAISRVYGNYEKSMELIAKARDLARDIYLETIGKKGEKKEVAGGIHPVFADIAFASGEIERSFGNYSVAINAFEESVTIRRQFFDKQHMLTAMSLYGIARTYFDVYYSNAYSKPEKSDTAPDPAMGIYYDKINDKHPDLKKSIQFLDRAVSMCKKFVGDDHRFFISFCSLKGEINVELKQFEDAKNELSNALQVTRMIYTATEKKDDAVDEKSGSKNKKKDKKKTALPDESEAERKQAEAKAKEEAILQAAKNERNDRIFDIRFIKAWSDINEVVNSWFNDIIVVDDLVGDAGSATEDPNAENIADNENKEELEQNDTNEPIQEPISEEKLPDTKIGGDDISVVSGVEVDESAPKPVVIKSLYIHRDIAGNPIFDNKVFKDAKALFDEYSMTLGEMIDENLKLVGRDGIFGSTSAMIYRPRGDYGAVELIESFIKEKFTYSLNRTDRMRFLNNEFLLANPDAGKGSISDDAEIFGDDPNSKKSNKASNNTTNLIIKQAINKLLYECQLNEKHKDIIRLSKYNLEIVVETDTTEETSKNEMDAVTNMVATGNDYFVNGLFNEAKNTFEDCISLFNDLYPNNKGKMTLKTEYAQVLVCKGKINYYSSYYSLALDNLSSGIDIYRKCLAIANCDIVASPSGNFEDFTDLLTIIGQGFSNSNNAKNRPLLIQLSDAMILFAETNRRLGLTDKALLFHEKTLGMKKALFETSDSRLINSLVGVANCYYDLGRYFDAIFYLNQGMEIYNANKAKTSEFIKSAKLKCSDEVIIGMMNYDLFVTYTKLQIAIGDYESSQKYIDQTIVLFRQYFADSHFLVSDILYQKAKWKIHNGKYEAAKKIADKVLKIRVESYGRFFTDGLPKSPPPKKAAVAGDDSSSMITANNKYDPAAKLDKLAPSNKAVENPFALQSSKKVADKNAANTKPDDDDVTLLTLNSGKSPAKSKKSPDDGEDDELNAVSIDADKVSYAERVAEMKRLEEEEMRQKELFDKSIFIYEGQGVRNDMLIVETLLMLAKLDRLFGKFKEAAATLKIVDKMYNQILQDDPDFVDEAIIHDFDKDGRPIDKDGNLLNDEGQRIDKDGNLIGKDGKPLTVDESIDKSWFNCEIYKLKVEFERTKLLLLTGSLINCLKAFQLLADKRIFYYSRNTSSEFSNANTMTMHIKVIEALKNVASIKVLFGQYQEAYYIYSQIVPSLKECLTESNPKTMAVLIEYSQLLRAIGKFGESSEILSRLGTVLQAKYGDLKNTIIPVISKYYSELAMIHMEKSDFSTAKIFIEHALLVSTIIYGQNSLRSAFLSRNFAYILLKEGQFNESKKVLEDVIIIIRNICGKYHFHTVSTILLLAICYFEMSELVFAKPIFVRTIQLIHRELSNYYYNGNKSDNTIDKDIVEVGVTEVKNYFKTGANENLAKVIRISNLYVDSNNHPFIADCYHYLGKLHYLETSLIESKKCLDKAILMKQRIYLFLNSGNGGSNTSHVSISDSLLALGQLLLVEGKTEEAISVYDDCLAIRKSCYTAASANTQFQRHQEKKAIHTFYNSKFAQGINASSVPFTNNIVIAEIYDRLGEALFIRGDYPDAKNYLEKSISIRRHIFAEYKEGSGGTGGHYTIALSQFLLSKLYRMLGNTALSFLLLKRALDVLLNHFGPNHYIVVQILHEVTAHYHQRGYYFTAEKLLKDSLKIIEKLFISHTSNTNNNKHILYIENLLLFAENRNLRGFYDYIDDENPDDKPSTARSIKYQKLLHQISKNDMDINKLEKMKVVSKIKTLGEQQMLNSTKVNSKEQLQIEQEQIQNDIANYQKQVNDQIEPSQTSAEDGILDKERLNQLALNQPIFGNIQNSAPDDTPLPEADVHSLIANNSRDDASVPSVMISRIEHLTSMYNKDNSKEAEKAGLADDDDDFDYDEMDDPYGDKPKKPKKPKKVKPPKSKRNVENPDEQTMAYPMVEDSFTLAKGALGHLFHDSKANHEDETKQSGSLNICEHPLMLRIAYMLAKVLLSLGEFSLSSTLTHYLVRMNKRVFGEMHMNYVDVLLLLANNLLATGKVHDDDHKGKNFFEVGGNAGSLKPSLISHIASVLDMPAGKELINKWTPDVTHKLMNLKHDSLSSKLRKEEMVKEIANHSNNAIQKKAGAVAKDKKELPSGPNKSHASSTSSVGSKTAGTSRLSLGYMGYKSPTKKNVAGISNMPGPSKYEGKDPRSAKALCEAGLNILKKIIALNNVNFGASSSTPGTPSTMISSDNWSDHPTAISLLFMKAEILRAKQRGYSNINTSSTTVNQNGTSSNTIIFTIIEQILQAKFRDLNSQIALDSATKANASGSHNVIANDDVAMMYNSLAELYKSENKLNKSFPFYTLAKECLMLTFKEDIASSADGRAVHPRIAEIDHNLAIYYFSIGNFKESKSLFESSLNARRQLFGNSSILVAQSLCGIASIVHRLSSFNSNISVDLKHNITSNVDTDNANSNNNNNNSGINIDAAIEMYQKALKITFAKFGEWHFENSTILNSLGLSWKEKGRFDEAIEAFESALDILYQYFYNSRFSLRQTASITKDLTDGNIDSIIGNHMHPDIVSVENNLASLYAAKGDHKIAKWCYVKIIEKKRILFDNNHLLVASSLHNLANVHFHLKEYVDAKRCYDEALKIRVSLVGNNSVNSSNNSLIIAETLHNIGLLFFHLGQPQEAIANIEKSISIKKNIYNTENHKSIASSIHNLAIVFHKTNDFVYAENYYIKAHNLFGYLFGEYHSETVACLDNLRMCLKDKRRWSETMGTPSGSGEANAAMYHNASSSEGRSEIKGFSNMNLQGDEFDRDVSPTLEHNYNGGQTDEELIGDNLFQKSIFEGQSQTRDDGINQSFGGFESALFEGGAENSDRDDFSRTSLGSRGF